MMEVLNHLAQLLLVEALHGLAEQIGEGLCGGVGVVFLLQSGRRRRLDLLKVVVVHEVFVGGGIGGRHGADT